MGRFGAFRVAPELLPGLLAVGVFIAWAAQEGGFEPTTWYPGALFLLGAVVAVVLAYRARLAEIPRPTRWALALLGAFTLWSYLSIAWADVQGDAWEGANRTLLYLTVFAVFALPAWRAASATVALGAYSIGIAVLAAVVLLEAAGSSEPLLAFIGGRLAEPTGYHNAAAALFLAPAFPALFLASRRETPWPARAVLLACAGLLIQVAILPQSRGSLIAFPIALLFYLAVVPDRARSTIAIVPVAAATALAAPALLEVYTTIQDQGDVGGALDDARQGAALSFAALLLIGGALGLADRAIRVPERTARLTGRGLGLAGAAALLVGIVVFLSAVGSPVTWAGDRWEDFKGGYEEQGFGSSRFGGGLGSNRYDFWRVSIEELGDSPLAGMGTENFATAYLGERRSAEEPAHPHSLPVRVVSQTGVVGGLLFFGFLAAALTAAASARWRAASPLGRATAGAALVPFAYWFVHSSGDWFWALPGLSAPAFAWLGMAGRIERSPAPEARPAASRGLPAKALAAAAVIVAVLAASSYALSWGAARDIEVASGNWGADPEAAYERLDRARALSFLGDDADVVAGAIASREGDFGRMRDSFENALERNPHNWYALLELGALDALQGRRAEALEHLDAAERLNPREPLIELVARRARNGDPISLNSIDARFLERICGLVGRTDETPDCPEG